MQMSRPACTHAVPQVVVVLLLYVHGKHLRSCREKGYKNENSSVAAPKSVSTHLRQSVPDMGQYGTYLVTVSRLI